MADGVERVKLTDFGLARAADDASLTKTGIIAGTPQYMSPEQARGESVDQRSDLFSLGSVLYTMCTGRAPFRAETSYGVLRRITDEEPRPIREINPDIPEWLCRIVAKLMSKRPEDRFQSAREVAELLEECLAHVQQPTAVPLPASLAMPSKGSRFFPISRRWKGLIAMIGTLGLGLLAMALLQATEPPDIAGEWTGEGWGNIVLKMTEAGQYTGKYGDAAGRHPGEIELKWSRIQRRFNGTWREDEDRFGELSVRMADQEIRGALTTDPKAKINPATPRLADLLWTRVEATTSSAEAAAGATRAEGKPSVVIDIAENRGGPWMAKLSEGVTVELAGAGDDSRWWQPNGFLLEKSLYEYKESGVQTWPKTGVRRVFFARVDNRTAGPCGMNYDVTPRSELSGPGTLGSRAVPNRVTELPFAAYVPASDHTATVRVGVSFGPWEDIASKKYDSGQEQGGSRKTVGNLSRAIEAKDAVVIVSQDRLPADEVHVVAVRTDGRLVEAQLQFESDTDGRQLTATFPSVTLKQLKEIKLQHRRYTWVEFRNVSLQPKQKTDVQVVVGGTSAPTGGAEAAPPAAQAKEPDEFSLRLGGAIKREQRFNTRFRVQTIACSPDGKLIAVGNVGPDVYDSSTGPVVLDKWLPLVDILDAETGNTVVSLKLTSSEDDSLSFAASALRFMHNGGGRVPYCRVKALAFSPDGSLLAVGTNVGQVKLFNTRTGELVRALDDEAGTLADKKTPESAKALKRAMGSVAALAFSPDGSLLAMAGGSFDDNPLVDDGNPQGYMRRQAKLATGPGRVKVWDVATGKRKHDLVGHGRANAVAFSPDGNFLASTGTWLNENEGEKE